MNAITITKSTPGVVALPSIVSGEFASLPGSVQKAIVKLDLAYPAGVGNLCERENELRREVYAEAIEGFPVVVARGALKHLLLKNPRNPFAPTPQDVHELCIKFQQKFVDALVRYMLGNNWAAPEFAGGCPAPGTPGHPLPMERVRELARGTLAWGLALSRYGLDDNWDDEAFNRIHPEMFDRGEREKIVEKRDASRKIRSEGRGPEYFRLQDEVATANRLERSLTTQSATELLVSLRKKSLAKK